MVLHIFYIEADNLIFSPFCSITSLWDRYMHGWIKNIHSFMFSWSSWCKSNIQRVCKKCSVKVVQKKLQNKVYITFFNGIILQHIYKEMLQKYVFNAHILSETFNIDYGWLFYSNYWKRELKNHIILIPLVVCVPFLGECV